MSSSGSSLARATHGIADLVGPRRCVGCGRPGASLCRPCLLRTRRADARPPPPNADGLVVAFAYEGVARSLVLGLKLRGLACAAEPLGEALAVRVLQCGVLGRTVTWVPGRRVDIRRRGFDHARAIAEALAARLGLPPLPLLSRGRASADQAGLDAAERWSNLAGVFRSRRCSGGVVLVDDLITTGATARACAQALHNAGASTVEVAAACSASLPELREN